MLPQKQGSTISRRFEKFLFFGTPLIFIAALLYPYRPGDDWIPCAFKVVTKLYCPGCGLRHSLIALMNSQFMSSLEHNPMGIVAAVLLIYLWSKILFKKYVLKRSGSVIGSGELNVVAKVFIVGLFTHWFFYLGCEFVRQFKLLV